MKKIAVVLLNLGAPDKIESVQPFLFNLFNDKAIIGLPQPLRGFLARLISRKRAPIASEIYREMGGSSPLLKNTQQQADALEASLGGDVVTYKTFIAMRYWHPMTEETAQKVIEWQPDKIVLLPLYPQFSTTTTGSSFNVWNKYFKSRKIEIPTTTVCCYPTHPQWVNAVVTKLKDSGHDLSKYRLLFSAHGLPEKIVKGGDPYQWQVEQTVAAVVQLLPEINDHIVCYQSRVGPLQWITPNTEDEIKRAGVDQKPILLIPIAFVSEHSETLVELDIEYKEVADEYKVPDYQRLPTVDAQEFFIAALKERALAAASSDKTILPPAEFSSGQCPQPHCKCISRVYNNAHV